MAIGNAVVEEGDTDIDSGTGMSYCAGYAVSRFWLMCCVLYGLETLTDHIGTLG